MSCPEACLVMLVVLKKHCGTVALPDMGTWDFMGYREGHIARMPAYKDCHGTLASALTFMGVQIFERLLKGLWSARADMVLHGLPKVMDGGDTQVERHWPGRGGFTRIQQRAWV